MEKVSDSLLLKIHRDFKHDEAVKLLEQQIKALNFEIGILKSEAAEERDKAEKLKEFVKELSTQMSIFKTPKQVSNEVRKYKDWLKDDLIKDYETRITENKKALQAAHKKASIVNKEAKQWKQRYLDQLNRNSVLENKISELQK